jgi:THO complex subunit 5
MGSSIYQDIPLYSIDEFKSLAPSDAHTDEVLSSEHQLMLNRLTFELAERQRLAISVSHELGLIILFRLDLKKKELIQQKEALLKESKVKASTMDSVKSQLDVLMKVRFHV